MHVVEFTEIDLIWKFFACRKILPKNLASLIGVIHDSVRAWVRVYVVLKD